MLLGDLYALGGGGLGVGGTHVGDQLDLVLPAQGQSLFHTVLQQAVIALGGVLQLCLLTDGDGTLGQALKADVIQITLFDQFEGGFQTVTGVTGAGTDANGFHRGHILS